MTGWQLVGIVGACVLLAIPLAAFVWAMIHELLVLLTMVVVLAFAGLLCVLIALSTGELRP